MAEAILKDALKREGLLDIEVSSAGIHALVGEEPPEAAVELLARRGIDLSGHRGRQLNRFLIEEADLILAMDRYQLGVIESFLPQSSRKVLLLRAFSPKGGFEISDPFGGNSKEYRHCLSQIDESLPALLEKIRGDLLSLRKDSP